MLFADSARFLLFGAAMLIITSSSSSILLYFFQFLLFSPSLSAVSVPTFAILYFIFPERVTIPIQSITFLFFISRFPLIFFSSFSFIISFISNHSILIFIAPILISSTNLWSPGRSLSSFHIHYFHLAIPVRVHTHGHGNR